MSSKDQTACLDDVSYEAILKRIEEYGHKGKPYCCGMQDCSTLTFAACRFSEDCSSIKLKGN